MAIMRQPEAPQRPLAFLGGVDLGEWDEMKQAARQTIAIMGGALLVLTMLPAPAPAQEASGLPPGGTFYDDDGTPAEGYIEALRAVDITRGCNPPANDFFCPKRVLTRAEMATMFARAFDLPAALPGRFTDTANSVHAASIDALAAAGITLGCNPPDNTEFCPDRPIDRGEMAAFLSRALELPAAGDTDYFQDDATSVFETAINRLAAAGITSGCGTGAYCPYSLLPRSEMAVLLARALGLTPLVPPERPPPPFPDVGEGKRIIYANREQRVWLVDERNQLVDTYLVSGREAVPAPGTYHIFSKSVNAWAGHNGITMRWMARFAVARSGLAIGMHAIPRYSNGQPMQTEDELGYYRSGGCVRQPDDKAQALYDWAPIGTTVIVLP